MITPVRSLPMRVLTIIVCVITALALALTTTPGAEASPVTSPTPVPRSDVHPDAESTTAHPTKKQLKQAKVAWKVLNARPKDKGTKIDFRKALKAAGRHNKVIAQDVALGMIKAGGKVTHISKREHKALIKRARKLGQKGVARKLADSRMTPDGRTRCKGVNRIDGFWWGYRGKLDSCRADFIHKSLETVAFTGGLLAVLYPLDPRGKAIMTVTVAIVGVGIFTIGRCKEEGRGIVLYHATTVGVGDIWCVSQ
jgi:hypothetical protein